MDFFDFLGAVFISTKCFKGSNCFRVFSRFHQCNRIVIFAVRDNYRIKNNREDHDCANSCHSGSTNDYGYLFLACSFLLCNFCQSLTLDALCLKLYLDLFDLLLASYDLRIRILPAGNRLKQLNRRFIIRNLIDAHFLFSRFENGIFSCDLTLLTALLCLFGSILVPGHRFKQLCCIFIFTLRLGFGLYPQRTGINTVQTRCFVAGVNVFDIVSQGGDAKAHRLLVVVATVKGFGTVFQTFLFFDPQLCQQLTQVGLAALRI